MRQNSVNQNKTNRYYSADRVRRSLAHYLFGRGTASLASFASAIVLIQIFSVSTYAMYTALSGLLLLITMVSNAGIDGITLRFLPELKQTGAEHSIRVYSIWLFVIRMIFTLLLLIPIYFFSDKVASYLSIEQGSLAFFSFCVFVLIRTASLQLSLVLQALLHQREASIGSIIEYLIRLAAIVYGFLYLHSLTLDRVYWIFSASCGLGVIYLFWKVCYFTRINNDDKNKKAPKEFFLRRLIRLGWHNYLDRIMGYPGTSGAGRLLAAWFLTSLETAMLGFAYTLSDVMMRYLPAKLLIGLIEPVFMARYSENREFANLNQMASIVYKINLFIITPAAVWMALAGAPVIELITSGKYTDAKFIIAALMILMVLKSHQLVLRMIVNAVEETQLLVKSNVMVLLLLPSYLVLIHYFGLVGLIAGSISLAAFRNSYIISKLRKSGYAYKLDWLRVLRIVFAAMGSALIVHLSAIEISNLWHSIAAAIAISCFYLLILYFRKSFSASERQMLNRFAGRKIVIW